jgi:hypothetical protein
VLLLLLPGLPHNDIAAQICRQAGLVKHPDGSKGHGHGTADLLGVEEGQVGGYVCVWGGQCVRRGGVGRVKGGGTCGGGQGGSGIVSGWVSKLLGLWVHGWVTWSGTWSNWGSALLGLPDLDASAQHAEPLLLCCG